MTFRFPTLRSFFHKKKITAILTYHAVYASDDNPLIADRIHNIPPDMLYAQLNLLKKRFSILPLDELVEKIKQGHTTQGLAAVTFDDGYGSVLDNAFPVLKSLNIPATFFLSTQLIEAQTFWRDKVRYIINKKLVDAFLSYATERDPNFPKIDSSRFYSESKDPEIINSKVMDNFIDDFLKEQGVTLSALSHRVYCSSADFTGKSFHGFTFGNHGHSHYVLSSMTREEQYEDMASGKKILSDLDLPVSRVFSIPFGTPRDFNEDTLDILKDLGYDCYVLSTGKGACDVFAGFGSPCDRRGLIALSRFMPVETMRFLEP